ncbi:MAG: hypothetical protein LBQ50_04560, partial [Planctomycetaceae bacterium]|nr:hypothetical protein [Planctomycetaceae bacterium]
MKQASNEKDLLLNKISGLFFLIRNFIQSAKSTEHTKKTKSIQEYFFKVEKENQRFYLTPKESPKIFLRSYVYSTPQTYGTENQ